MSIFQELVPSLRLGSWTPSSIRKHLFGDESQSIEALCAMMMKLDGEYSSLLIAERILDAYKKLDQDGRSDFFKMLNTEYDLDVDSLGSAVAQYAEKPDTKTLKQLTREAEPRRQELFRRLNMAPGGTQSLVKMREHLLQLSRKQPELAKMDVDFRHLFSSWFNRGFLLMQPIDWTTPAHILEKITAYEAVHEIRNWNELRRRLEPQDRYCYAFFHPAMDDEPLVFVEVALTDEIPSKIDQILHQDRALLSPDQASCAVFYSISNCHSGLAGVSFGNFLIKQVATGLQLRFPHLKKFATISPVPGFKNWLIQKAAEEPAVAELIEQAELRPEEIERERLAASILKLAARYFLEEKSSYGTPIDPVARFHLKNGACLERFNIAADLSDKGMTQSLGLMVNYIYNLAKVEENHENYMKNHKVVCSNQIKKLLLN
ncbi:MAG: malonyl-CoA decarboxylase [Arenicellales bacterium]